MTNAELEQTVSRHDSEIAEIRTALVQIAQQTQESAQRIATIEAIHQESAQRIATIETIHQESAQRIAATEAIQQANAEQIAANTAGLVELRGILADYLRGRSHQ